MLNEENLKKIEEIGKRYPEAKAALLPALWIAQEQDGWISEETMKQIGDLLGLPYGHVLGVVTFYTMFNSKPLGTYHIEVCTNASCQLRGSDKILRKVEHVCSAGAGHTSPDGKWTVNEVECMGACGGAPMIAIGEEYYENLTPDKVEEILRKLP
ncbi:MAG: NAD(P)H-dependent oxidoreductase subunit E [Ignavibacteriales bacterium]|nr:NAD(P)H-dependent oxidoreductase subunit E [Ignavibacteriales bacterium]